MEGQDARDYSWVYATVDQVIAEGPTELLYAYLVVSAGSTDSALYDGTDTSGTLIADLKSAAVTGHEFKPPKPVFCHKGLFVDVGTSVSGIFIQYRNVGRNKQG